MRLAQAAICTPRPLEVAHRAPCAPPHVQLLVFLKAYDIMYLRAKQVGAGVSSAACCLTDWGHHGSLVKANNRYVGVASLAPAPAHNSTAHDVYGRTACWHTLHWPAPPADVAAGSHVFIAAMASHQATL